MTLAAVARPRSSPARARARPRLGCGRHARRVAVAESPRSAPRHGPDSAEWSSADRGKRRGGRIGHTRSDANAGHTRAMIWARLPRIPDSARPCLRHRRRPSRCSSRARGRPAAPPRERARRAAPHAARCSRGPSVGAPHDRCHDGVPPRTQPARTTQVAALRRSFGSGRCSLADLRMCGRSQRCVSKAPAGRVCSGLATSTATSAPGSPSPPRSSASGQPTRCGSLPLLLADARYSTVAASGWPGQ